MAFSDDLPKIGLYIHLPWCEKKCPYCDFNVTTSNHGADVKELIDSILSDIDRSQQLIQGRLFSSVYIGGGTPSILSVKYIDKILVYLKKNNLIEQDIEISIEINPSDLTLSYLNELESTMVNRVSVGIQSFSDKELEALGRNHDGQKSHAAIEILTHSKMKKSIDLIYGSPCQTLESLEENLKIFFESNIAHLSLYQLTIEPNTVFFKKMPRLPNEDLIHDMELLAEARLNEKLFFQYEVSSWSRDNLCSDHNMNYWTFGDFLGVGPGAHSKIYMNNIHVRFKKRNRVKAYIENPKPINFDLLENVKLDHDLAMNIFRLKDGIKQRTLSLNQINTSDRFNEKYALGVNMGLLKDEKFCTSKTGFRYLNDVIHLFG